MSWKRFIQRLLGRKGEAGPGKARKKPEPRINERTGESRAKLVEGEARGATELSMQPTVGTNARRRQVVIGLDFGTAYTKVVLRIDEKRYAVAYDPYVEQGNDYLLPSLLYESADGEYRFRSSAGDRVVGDIKMRLLNEDYSVEALLPMVAYVALVLRHVRRWFLSTYQDLYGSDAIDWYVNVGLPTESHEIDRLHNAYRQVLESAWIASIKNGPVIRIEVKEILQKIQSGVDGRDIVKGDLEDRLIHKENIALFPEFVAQVAGYVRSTRRQNGTHGLIDVGAGTVDATVFRVVTNAEGDDIHPILSKSTQPLGVEILLQKRLESVGVEQNRVPVDDRYKLLQGTEEDVAGLLNISTHELENIDTYLRERVIKQITDAIQEARELQLSLQSEGEHRYADPVWEGAMPTFHCGGGAKHQFYRSVIKHFELQAPPSRLERRSLPMPEDLTVPGLPRDAFDRLSVAYGLSYDADDLAEITRPKPPDHPRPRPTRVCPDCGGYGGGYQNCARCGGKGFL